MPNIGTHTGSSTKDQSQASAGRPFNPDGGEMKVAHRMVATIAGFTTTRSRSPAM